MPRSIIAWETLEGELMQGNPSSGRKQGGAELALVGRREDSLW